MSEQKTVLVVDDDQDIIEIYTLLLEKENYRVITAFNSDSGFKAVQMHHPDLMILDIMMETPDSGFVLAQKLVDNDYHLPIILSSSIAKAASELFDTTALNIKGIVQKTSDFKVLMDLINKQLAV